MDKNDVLCGTSSDSTYIGKISSELLNEHNYLQWPHSAQMYIGAKQKINYIDGTTMEPDSNDPSHKDWKAINYLMLLHSMGPHIQHMAYMLPTTKDIWDTVHNMYPQQNNYACIYQLY